MRLDKNICLGGRFNNKEVIGIKLNGHIIYEYGYNSRIYEPYEFRDDNDLVTVDTLVTSVNTHLDEMFENCNHLTTINGIDEWDTSNIKTMANMFWGCESLTSGALNGINDWNVSKVNDMSGMFGFCFSLSTLDLSKWDTSNVQDMSYMFQQCRPVSGGEGLTELNLSGWNTSKVTDMSCMFTASPLHVLDIRNFDMTNVTKTDDMIPMGNRLHTLRLDNCSYDSIKKIIKSKNFPSVAQYQGLTRKIYINPDNKGDLTPPTNWVFVNKDTEEIIS